MANAQPVTPPLSVLLLLLRRQKNSRILSLAITIVISIFGLATMWFSDSQGEFYAGLLLFLGMVAIGVFVMSRETTAIRATQDQIALAQAALPPGTQPTGAESNLGLWLTFVGGLIAAAAVIIAAIIAK